MLLRPITFGFLGNTHLHQLPTWLDSCSPLGTISWPIHPNKSSNSGIYLNCQLAWTYALPQGTIPLAVTPTQTFTQWHLHPTSSPMPMGPLTCMQNPGRTNQWMSLKCLEKCNFFQDPAANSGPPMQTVAEAQWTPYYNHFFHPTSFCSFIVSPPTLDRLQAACLFQFHLEITISD